MSKERLLPTTAPVYYTAPELRIQETDSTIDAHIRPKYHVPQRVIISILVFIGLLIVYVLRVNLSVAILPISEQQRWDPSVKGIALSSFFWGYVCTQLLGALLSKKFGGKPLFGFAVLGASIFTAVLPYTVFNYYLFLACRIFTGLCEGVAYPSVQFIISKWIPDKERSSAVSFMWSGAYLGSIVAMMGSPIVIDWAGWPSIFYLSAAAGLVWFLVWTTIATSTPQQSRFISAYELRIIQLGILDEDMQKKTPWKKIFTSVPVWAIIVNYFCMNWGFYTLLTWMPSYMKDDLNFNLENAGFLSVLPYVAVFFVTIIGGRTSDFILSKGANRTLVRKVFFCTGTAVPALFLALLCRHPTPHQAVVFLVCAVGSTGLGTSAIGPNTLDVVGEYSGILIGVSNMLGNIPGIIAVAATGFILEQTNNSWCVVFLISSGVYMFGCIVWILFATGKRVI